MLACTWDPSEAQQLLVSRLLYACNHACSTLSSWAPAEVTVLFSQANRLQLRLGRPVRLPAGRMSSSDAAVAVSICTLSLSCTCCTLRLLRSSVMLCFSVAYCSSAPAAQTGFSHAVQDGIMQAKP